MPSYTDGIDTGLIEFGPTLLVPAARQARSVRSEEDVLMARALRKESAAQDPAAPPTVPAAEPPGVGHAESEPPSDGPESSVSTQSAGGGGDSGSSGDLAHDPPPGPREAAGLAGLIAQMLAIAVAAAAIALIALKVSGLLTPTPPRIVTFDVLKYENAERAAAMKLMGRGGTGAVAPMLSYMSGRLRTAIRKAAGPGTLVVVSEAVVQGQTRDITDRVLKSLGLPTQVPTAKVLKPLTLLPGTMLPPVLGSAGSPLSRLIESGARAKHRSIVP